MIEISYSKTIPRSQLIDILQNLIKTLESGSGKLKVEGYGLKLNFSDNLDVELEYELDDNNFQKLGFEIRWALKPSVKQTEQVESEAVATVETPETVTPSVPEVKPPEPIPMEPEEVISEPPTQVTEEPPTTLESAPVISESTSEETIPASDEFENLLKNFEAKKEELEKTDEISSNENMEEELNKILKKLEEE
ncbi:MAG: amphi-Trp domain-containing protein [Candidatus Odinarchaeia archaeon]